ncbi:hypothetical protein MRX96_036591 [Rhipicephalus microplus]
MTSRGSERATRVRSSAGREAVVSPTNVSSTRAEQRPVLIQRKRASAKAKCARVRACIRACTSGAPWVPASAIERGALERRFFDSPGCQRSFGNRTTKQTRRREPSAAPELAPRLPHTRGLVIV